MEGEFQHGARGGARTVAILLAIALLAMAILLVAAGSRAEGKVPKAFFGLTQGGSFDPQDAEQLHSIKVRTMRIGLNWGSIEAQRGSFVRWPDELVTALAKNGIRPVFNFYGAPKWATGAPSRSSPPVTARALRAWQDFLKTAVRHYGPNGSFWHDHPGLPEQPATAWQIWNEPNLPKFFTKRGTDPPKLVKHAPKAYARLVKVSDRAIGKVDRHAKVILAGLLGNPNRGDQSKMDPEKFFKKFFKARKITKHFDAAAIHPYAPDLKKYKKVIAMVRKAMKRGGAGHKDLWLDEVGWGSARNGLRLNKGTRGQAKMLRKSFKLTVNKRKEWRIGRVFWFDWRDPDPSRADVCSFCGSAGLLKFDRRRKPSYRQFKHFTKLQGKAGRHRHRHHHHHHHHHG